MYLADYHVHSRISPDASASMQEMAEAAIRLGFQEICFTDHVEPIRFGTTEPRGAYDWDPMIAEFRAARTAVGDRITLRLGAELGDAVWGIRRMESMLAEAPPLDFLIGSIHTLSEKMEGRDLYFLTPRDEQEARDCLADYLGQVRKLAEWGRFQVLGHLTLPLRYLNENRGMHVSFDGFEEEIAEIFRLIIPKGIGIELNTNRGNTPLPDEKWLRLYRSLGGEIVTLGTDAEQVLLRPMLHIPAAERHLHPDGGVVAVVEIAEVFKYIPLALRRSQAVVDILEGDGLGEGPALQPAQAVREHIAEGDALLHCMGFPVPLGLADHRLDLLTLGAGQLAPCPCRFCGSCRFCLQSLSPPVPIRTAAPGRSTGCWSGRSASLGG